MNARRQAKARGKRYSANIRAHNSWQEREYYQLLYDMLGKGFTKVRVDGKLYSLRERIVLAKHKKHEIYFLVDEIEINRFGKSGKAQHAYPKPLREPFMKLADWSW